MKSKFKVIRIFSFCAISAFLAAACELEIPVTGISLDKRSADIPVGGKETITAAVAPFNATNQKVTWSSGNNAVATVSQAGLVRGVSAGSATITASTVDGGFAAFCDVTVSGPARVPVTGVTLNINELPLSVGGSYALSASVAPYNAENQKVSWSSGDAAVATVTQAGLVRGVSEGSALITVTSDEGGFKAECSVSVSANPVLVEDVFLSANTLSLNAEETATLIARISPANAANQNVSWSSGNNAVATVTQNGLVRGVAAGTTLIKVTSDEGGKTAECSVSVSAAVVKVEGVSLDKSTLSLGVEETATLNAKINPSNAENQKVSWSSTNNAVATVTQAGLVRGVAAGSAVIKVTTEDGGKTAECAVTVSGLSVPTPSNLAAYLATLPTNTASSPHKITLKVNSASDFSLIRTALNSSRGANKYVSLDLSGSAITAVPDLAFNTGEPLYDGCGTLVGITIPAGVTNIGTGAFNQCVNLASVTLPPGLESFGEAVFNFCESLASVTLPDSVTNMGIRTFANCGSLASVNIPAGAAAIGVSVFYNCPRLAVIDIPNTVKSIGDYAFSGCAFESLIIPDNVTSIGSGAFSNCKNLSGVTLPEGLTIIEGSTFADCVKLPGITLPSGLTEIRTRAFKGCKSLASADIPSGVKSVGGWAFSECESLFSVTIPEGVSGIENNAFSLCKNLASVTIPASVTSIGASAFYGSALASVNIPDKVTSIGDSAFSTCESLYNVSMGSGVESIGANAFYGCGVLADITIPDKVTSIGDGAFRECASLASVSLGSGLESIGANAFNGCAILDSVNIPDKVTSIGDSAFRACDSLYDVSMGSGLTSIGANAFNGCAILDSINIPDSVKSIGNGVFQNCSSLASVSIGSGLASISANAFNGCASLADITIPDNVKSIGNGAFNGCDGLESVTFQGTMPSSGFSTSAGFSGDLRAKFYAANASNGTPGTYARASGGVTWTKQ